VNDNTLDDSIDARARAAADRLVASFADVDTDAELHAVRRGAISQTFEQTHGGQKRWLAIAAAGVLVVGGTVALAANVRSGPSPATDPTPTEPPASVPAVLPAPTAPSTTPATTEPPATTLATEVSASVSTVSYLAPPPVLPIRSLGTVSVPPRELGSYSVAIGDAGVAVSQSPYSDDAPTRIDVIDLDGQIRTLADVDADVLLAYGPGDVAYLSRQGVSIDEFAVVAVPLSGAAAGTAVASEPADINLFVEYPPLSFGHSTDGVVHRREYLRGEEPVISYVDTDGNPAVIDTDPATFASDSPDDAGSGLGGTITSSTGTSWSLTVEAAPDRADTYAGFSPPAPGSDGRGVYVTHIGPDGNPTVDFGEATIRVIATLNPDGTAEWWSLPVGWQVVASDIWGTVLAKHTDNQLELALADFPDSTPRPTPTTAPETSTSTAAPLVSTQLGSCPTLSFSALAPGWEPILKDEQGGGSGLPGNHIGGVDSYVNLFAGGSVFGPRAGNETVVDGYSAIRGPIEGGLGLRINIGETDCEFFDLHFYGITERDVTRITEGLQITT
jgi:hypothetical protein